MRFFIYGGILALPYQVSHHAHKKTMWPWPPKNFISIWSWPAWRNHYRVIRTLLRLTYATSTLLHFLSVLRPPLQPSWLWCADSNAMSLVTYASIVVSSFVTSMYEAAMPSMIYYHQASGGGRPYLLFIWPPSGANLTLPWPPKGAHLTIDTLFILCYDQ